MPNPTTASPPLRPPRPSSRARAAGAALLAAALFAAAEAGAALLLGRFFALGRAEALLFVAFRPWLLVLVPAAVSGWAWQPRLLAYLLALALAAAAETAFLLVLCAPNPWMEMLRGLAAGAAVAALADLAMQAARRWRPRLGPVLAALAVLAAYAFAGAKPYEALVLGPTAPREAAARPALVVMTSLPIVWGPGGAFDPNSRPAAAWRLLQREYEVRLLDAIEPGSLDGTRLMLLAQPRLLAPEELAALDLWVRGGGRILILTDPRLAWALAWPPGDVRRPPEAGLLRPLLEYWGIALEPAPAGLVTEDVRIGAARYRLRMLYPGRFAVRGGDCRVGARPWLARCRIGRGEAQLVADADLLEDSLWTDPAAARGAERHLRIADNGLAVAAWLDALAGVRRKRTDRPAAWLAADAGRSAALLALFLPLVLALASGLGLLYASRRSSTTLSTGFSTVNNSRTNVPEDP